ncbi:MAG: isoprenyl transferase [Methylotenera sp.]|nr:isoprenyl transferase [Oligoflexia bacterium]
MSVQTRIPKHIAIIMDGNGRWAQKRHHPRVFGHIRGASRIREIVREANRLGVKALTLYAFSTENWSRPDQELNTLWKILKKFLIREERELQAQNVCLGVIGEIERLSADVRGVLDPALERLSKNTGLKLTFAVSYGSRRELMRATALFARDCVEGKHRPEDLTEDMLEQYFWTSQLGELADVDLVIRTSGEIRVSNFMLWQAAYAEFVFADVCWPDFAPSHLRNAIEQYSQRHRRFGGVNSAPTSTSTALISKPGAANLTSAHSLPVPTPEATAKLAVSPVKKGWMT